MEYDNNDDYYGRDRNVSYMDQPMDHFPHLKHVDYDAIAKEVADKMFADNVAERNNHEPQDNYLEEEVFE